MKKLFLGIAAMLFSANAFAAAECSQESLAELRSMTPEQARTCALHTETDMENKYEELLAIFADTDKELVESLRASQASWTLARNHTCKIVNRRIPTAPEYGTNAIRARNICGIIMNTNRSDFLAGYL